MPCYDSRDNPSNIRAEYSDKIKKLEAMLCALATFIESRSGKDNIEFVNVGWKEAGIPCGVFLNWWKQHKEDDRQRKQREQEVARRKLDKENALKKLTDREKKVLGLL